MMLTKPLFFLYVALSVFIALGTLRFIPLGIPVAFESMLPHIELRPTLFLTHILSSSIALAIGGFQLWDRFRQRRLNWHRWAGRVYVLSLLCIFDLETFRPTSAGCTDRLRSPLPL